MSEIVESIFAGAPEPDDDCARHLRASREQIATNVAALGCAKVDCNPDGPDEESPWRSRDGTHDELCPLSVAAAIREGKL